MNQMPLISVVIPLFNKEQWVKRTIDSVISQSYTHIEIVVVDDGSIDNSVAVVKKIDDQRIRIVEKTNGGVSSARNKGMKEAKGEYIAFLDADDEWQERHLEVLLKGFESFEKAIVLCDDLAEVRQGMKEGVRQRKLPSPLEASDRSEIRYFAIEDYLGTLADDYFILSGSSVLIQASVIREHDIRFSETLTHGEDVNFWIQLHQYGMFVFCSYLGVIYHHADAYSAMNRKREKAQLTPEYFRGLVYSEYSPEEQSSIKKFLRREYIKKAYQNRGLSWRGAEFSSKVGGDVGIGRLMSLVYLIVRFTPEYIYTLYRKWKNRG
jgi:glycosyltransferase involved in cell wall biosynthesis